MKLIYWDGPNCGDQLNPFLFPRLFPKLLTNGDDNEHLFGIGSILSARFISPDKKVIIFGSGMRSPATLGNTANFDLRFVRGPLTANCLSQPKAYITDSAYLLSLLEDFNRTASSTRKVHRTSIIPYFKYAQALPWQWICERTGMHFIDPGDPPEHVIQEILSSEHIIAGAMHGAILADVCRVPWIRLKMDQSPNESALTTEFKWADWMLSLNLDADRSVNLNSIDLQTTGSRALRMVFRIECFTKMRNRSQIRYQLSKDAILSKATTKLAEEVDRLRNYYQ